MCTVKYLLLPEVEGERVEMVVGTTVDAEPAQIEQHANI